MFLPGSSVSLAVVEVYEFLTPLFFFFFLVFLCVVEGRASKCVYVAAIRLQRTISRFKLSR